MSRSKNDLCARILKDLYGELPYKIGKYLMAKGACPLRLITTDTKIPHNSVKRVLWVLSHQNIVNFEQNKKSVIEYGISCDRILWHVRYPKYIYCAKTLYGDAAELMVEELLQGGQGLMSGVVSKVTERLNEALEASGHPKINMSLVKDKFSSLVRTHFLQRSLEPVKGDNDRVISLQSPQNREDLFQTPTEADGPKRKRSVDDHSNPTKKLRTEEGEKEVPFDDGLYWQVNFDRFHQHFRDQAIIDAVCNKIDKKAGEIVRTMLRLSEVRTEQSAPVTMPMSINEISQALPKDQGMTLRVLEQYLSIIADDSCDFVSKVGDSGGGMYVVNIFKSLTALCKAHIESLVQERFGSKCLRLFRVLLLKKHVEQKQIEECAMIPAKEAKELLYSMFAENFVSITEISKTPDHAPSRTFYLFKVDIDQVARMLLERCYKALANAMMRREMEVADHKRLLDKQERVEAIIASLEQEGGEAAQKEEIEQMITPPERAQLDKVKKTVNMLDSCEVQLDNTMFLLETYLEYTKIPLPVVKKKQAL
ncbi:DNA-directed RNA polymerase III subunit RPC3-like [Haliotis rubra]|uniref:DNA-directed RNA polymerase III subunit RPC3-like n=1 Tax=Haliotis rubra TaxID=36100 RepID=UPI001EE52E64|nr:DNA-directed RNA polymerase III subunit RPC3-like [Haliotis rubra]